MKLSTKIVLSFLAVGLTPFAVLGVVSLTKSRDALETAAIHKLEAVRAIKKGQLQRYFNERKGDMQVLVETVSTLQGGAFSKMTAVREAKSEQIQRYFDTAQKNICTFATTPTVVDALTGFSETLPRIAAENGLDAPGITLQRSTLRTYYSGPFEEAYTEANGAAAPALFDSLSDEAAVVQHYYIAANEHPIGAKQALIRAEDTSTYSSLHGAFHPFARNFLEAYGYYDIFLVDGQSGYVVYSVCKEADFGTSLIDGPFAKSGLAEAFRGAREAKPGEVVFADYTRYTPSYEAPAGFMATPVYNDASFVGVAIVQLPIDQLNAVMADRSGLGETGETYLVGPDKLMRSDSFLDPADRSVIASFRDPESGSVKTKAVEDGLDGHSGTALIESYTGSHVLSAYKPVQVANLTWVLCAEIDIAEAFCPKNGNGNDFFAQYAKEYGYYDLFLINSTGYCFYSVGLEADYQTNLLTGPYKDSNLGLLVKNALASRQFGMADFAPYAPSNGIPAAFIAQPVVHGDSADVVVALQLSLDSINAMMQNSEGMGETGETYLVGSDNLMRSDSRLSPEDHSVIASFREPDKGAVETVAVQRALAGEEGSDIITDYNGNLVLSAYAPLTIHGLNWALLAEVDVAEAFAAVQAMQRWLWIIAGIGLLGILGAAVLVYRNVNSTVVRPVLEAIENLSSGSEQVSSASTQVSQSSQQLAEGASELASSLEESSASLEEMASMTKQNRDNALEANAMAKRVAEAAGSGRQAMRRMASAMDELTTSSDQTARIIKTIDEIAFQTNLLALNAAVEAARAGEAGKGFAVVAEEVRNLAQRSAEAAKDTSALIEQSQSNTATGVDVSQEVGESLAVIGDTVDKMVQLINEVANATNEQAQGVDQINTAVAQMDQVTQQTAANSEEAASASEELAAQAEELASVVTRLAKVIGAGAASGEAKSSGVRVKDRPSESFGAKVPWPTPVPLRNNRAHTSENGSSRGLVAAGHRADQVIPLDDVDFGEF